MTGSPARLPSARALLVAAAVATSLCCALAAWGPRNPAAQGLLHSWLFTLIYYTGIAASVTVMGARALRPGPERLPWAFLTLGALSWLLADLVWFFLIARIDPAPSASVADVGYLLLFPFT